MKLIDNINTAVGNDLKENIKKGSKISMTAAYFSIYAYQELKKELEKVEELRFIFTSPTFIREKASKAKREFYIPRINREKSLYAELGELKEFFEVANRQGCNLPHSFDIFNLLFRKYNNKYMEAISERKAREAIKEAVTSCGFVPRIMDEIHHNHQIVPEMLYEIRESRFVIAELTEHNNGAYFEAGYALGKEKEVIQICKEDAFAQDGHFDVKQINTILWHDTDDLKEKLKARIRATLE